MRLEYHLNLQRDHLPWQTLLACIPIKFQIKLLNTYLISSSWIYSELFKLKTKLSHLLSPTAGVEFSDPDIKAMRGMEVKATPCWEGDKLVLKGSGGNGTATRELRGGQMVMTFDVMGTKATRFFNKA